MRTLVRWSLVGLLVAGVGCGSDVSPPETFADAGEADANAGPDAVVTDAQPPVDPAGANHLYVVNAIDVPTTVAEANALGLDIDGDASATVDNKLGDILAALATSGGNDPQDFINDRVADGTILQLINIKATSLSDATRIGFSLYVGADADVPENPSDNFSGFEDFNIAVNSPTDSLLAGTITAGQLSAWDGSIPLLISIADGVDPVRLDLVGARVEANPNGAGIAASKLGGGIREEQVTSDIYPTLEQTFDLTVAADCTGTVCAPGSNGQTLLNLFDTDNDGDITLNELLNSAFLNNLFASDLDLYDAEGFYNPNSDGVMDSLSFGIGFTAVGAQFIVPPLP